LIDRRRLIAAFASGPLVVPLAALGQSKEKVRRIGYIEFAAPGDSVYNDRRMALFVRELADRGYVDGKNVVLERRAVGGREDRIPALVAELVSLRVDVLVVVATPLTRAAKAATTTIPIVMLGASDPVGRGLVASLARPGGNITGLADFSTDLIPKKLELLKAAAPNITRVALVHQVDARYYDAAVTSALNQRYDMAARGLGISVVQVVLNEMRDFDRAAATVVRERADALLVDTTAVNYALRKDFTEFAIRERLPSIVTTSYSEAGLLAYGSDYFEVWRKGANYVAKILNGAKPAELPIEQPTRLELIVNLKMAKAIGLTIPQSLLLRADELIE
jgi:putative ABC transport system substrate-binding protein